jgi:hypothetical protein
MRNLAANGGRATVESALRLDIDDMMQWGGIRAFARLAGGMRFNFYGDQIEVKIRIPRGRAVGELVALEICDGGLLDWRGSRD